MLGKRQAYETERFVCLSITSAKTGEVFHRIKSIIFIFIYNNYMFNIHI